MLKVVLIFFVGVVGLCAAAAQLEEVFAWKEVSFAWPSEEAKNEAVKTGDYIVHNNLPLGVERWRDRIFVTVPRWKAGVASSLNYVPLTPANKTASLIPYPDWKANTLPKGEEKPTENAVISTFRVKVDACDRLWVMDTGLADILGSPNLVSPPAIVIFDLKTDKLIRRYTLKDSDLKGEESFFANIVVDATPDKCDEAFAYIPDLGGYGLVVYSFAENDSWRIKHNFFHFDPLSGDLTIGGVNFQWTDGLFGLALSPQNENGYRTLYFHALASTNEFSVNTEVLRNKTLATDPSQYNMFKLEGSKGPGSQTSASVLDEKTNILFLTQLCKDGVACWNTKKPLNPENLGLIVQDHENLIFTNDMKLDHERNLWILSDKMPIFIYKDLNPEEVNYRIFKVPVDEAIKGTICEA
ncbi:protein yellow [Anoplophora glabripennis]|uniref:protein yellow n=1 Tax=Anoplophora glabripennis TaxID=217634 RepID=UPI000874C905|nr:protein yellow [Anoplophora glabripennis]